MELLLKHFYCRLTSSPCKTQVDGGGGVEFASCNRMQEQYASLQPSIDCITSRKTLQARICNRKETKKINGENETKT